MTLRLGNKKVCPTKIVKVNNVDWNKTGYVFNSYGTDGTYDKILSGKVYAASGVYPRATTDETGTTKFVNFSQPFEINFEFTAPTITSHNHVLFGNGYYNQYFCSPACEYQANNSSISFWAGLSTSGTTWDYGLSFTPEEIPKVAGDTYNVNYKYDGSRFTLSVTHNNTTLTKSVTVTGTPYYSTHEASDGTYLSFGRNAGNGSTPLEGYFHAWNTYIKQNGVLVWGCEEGQDYIEVDPNNYLISNVTKVGDIEDNKGVLGGFVNSGTYAYTPTITLTEGSEVNISFIVPTSMFSDAPIISGWNSNYKGDVFIGGSNNKIWIWNNSNAFGGNTVMSANDQYSFKLVKNSSNLLDMYLKEGLPTSDISDYTLEFSNATDIISGNQIRLGIFNSQWFLYGFIDLNNCYIKIDGQIAWQGVVPQGTRG